MSSNPSRWCVKCRHPLSFNHPSNYCDQCYQQNAMPRPRTIARRCAPELRPDELDQVAVILRDYANRLDYLKPNQIAAVNDHRKERAETARKLADIITRTSVKTVHLDDQGHVVMVQSNSRPDGPPGRVEPEYSGGTPDSMAAIQRDLK